MGSNRGTMAIVCAAFVAAAGAPAAADDAAWPEDARSAQARATTKVYAEARARDRIGTIAKGTRLAWRRVVTTKDRCGAWLEVEPRGWVCARDVAPSAEAPDGARYPQLDTEGALGRFADVRGDEAPAFATLADVRAGTPSRQVPGTTFVAIDDGKEPKKIGGVRYVKTDQGWMAEKLLRPLTASEFEGVDLIATPPPGWPFAWVMPKKGEPARVRVEPSTKAAVVRELARRDLVPVLEITKAWARIGDGEWVARRDLRIVRVEPPPDGVAAGERWLDVDLEQQVLVAYEGETPVYATLVSSGKKKWATPAGIYRIGHKYASKRMTNPRAEDTTGESWDVAEVPWSMGFRKHFALHGAYWHDGFGTRRSHGCVNLSPRDARWVYEWSEPHVPDGWLHAEADDAAGTVVRIRSAYAPSPPWKDFDGKVARQ